jgi:hypothetical protein
MIKNMLMHIIITTTNINTKERIHFHFLINLKIGSEL